MLQTETVTIEHPDNPGAPMIINKSGFDPTVHKLYEPPAAEPAAETPKPEGETKPPEGEGSENKGRAKTK